MTGLKHNALLAVLAILSIVLSHQPSAVALAPDASPLATSLRGVVSILPEWPPNQSRTEEPEASGVVWSDGRHIVTAYHVVSNALSVRIRTSEGHVMQAELVGNDPATDLAVLRANEDLPASRIANHTPGIGERVCAIGNAFGLGLSLTCGVVSAINRAGVGFNPIEDFVQTDAAVNPGASGGALVTQDGAVVGVLSAIFTKKSDANIGVNFAVSIPLASRIVRELIAKGRVRHFKSGLRLAPAGLATKSAGRRELAPSVIAITPQSPAERAGLKIGDEIIEAAGRRTKTPAEFVSASAVTPGSLDVVVIRDGNRHNLTIERPDVTAD